MYRKYRAAHDPIRTRYPLTRGPLGSNRKLTPLEKSRLDRLEQKKLKNKKWDISEVVPHFLPEPKMQRREMKYLAASNEQEERREELQPRYIRDSNAYHQERAQTGIVPDDFFTHQMPQVSGQRMDQIQSVQLPENANYEGFRILSKQSRIDELDDQRDILNSEMHDLNAEIEDTNEKIINKLQKPRLQEDRYQRIYQEGKAERALSTRRDKQQRRRRNQIPPPPTPSTALSGLSLNTPSSSSSSAMSPETAHFASIFGGGSGGPPPYLTTPLNPNAATRGRGRGRGRRGTPGRRLFPSDQGHPPF